MWVLWLVGCATPDPRVAELEAVVDDLRARVERLEERPPLDVEDVLEAIQKDSLPEPVTDRGEPLEVTTALLDDPEQLAGMARLLLHRGPDGEYDGYRISAIRRGSLLDRVGIANGDIIHALNGHELTSMEASMRAYSEVVETRPAEVRLRITRRGTPVDLTIPITPADAPTPDKP